MPFQTVMKVPPAIREATAADAALITDILAEAFADDAVNLWVFGGVPALTSGIGWFTRKIYLKRGFGHISEAGDGATLWLAPGETKDLGLLDTLGVAATMISGGGVASLKRGMAIEDLMNARHPTEPHYYLWMIGTRADARGTGVGKALMQPVLDRADAEGVPCYLENSTADNLGFYRAHGFTVQEEFRIEEPNLPMWSMRRQPNPET